MIIETQNKDIFFQKYAVPLRCYFKLNSILLKMV
jgi:hypothetical protein